MAMVEVVSRVIGAEPGAGLGNVFFDAAAARITVRELLERTVEEQVRDLVACRRLSASQAWRELARQYQTPEEIVALREEEGRVTSTAGSSRNSPDIDVASAQRRAAAAFRRGLCLVIVEGRQMESLDEELTVGTGTRVEFLRVLPLHGG